MKAVRKVISNNTSIWDAFHYIWSYEPYSIETYKNSFFFWKTIINSKKNSWESLLISLSKFRNNYNALLYPDFCCNLIYCWWQNTQRFIFDRQEPKILYYIKFVSSKGKFNSHYTGHSYPSPLWMTFQRHCNPSWLFVNYVEITSRKTTSGSEWNKNNGTDNHQEQYQQICHTTEMALKTFQK